MQILALLQIFFSSVAEAVDTISSSTGVTAKHRTLYDCVARSQQQQARPLKQELQSLAGRRYAAQSSAAPSGDSDHSGPARARLLRRAPLPLAATTSSLAHSQVVALAPLSVHSSLAHSRLVPRLAERPHAPEAAACTRLPWAWATPRQAAPARSGRNLAPSSSGPSPGEAEGSEAPESRPCRALAESCGLS